MKRAFLLCLMMLPILLHAQRFSKKSVKTYREYYKSKFLKSERSPFYNKPDQLDQLRFFRPKKKYYVKCSFKATPKSEIFGMPTYSGIIKKFKKYGILSFKINGKNYDLAVYQNQMTMLIPQYKNELFLPFKDLTNGKSSYGGGRYINIDLNELKEGQPFYLDFNKNYNPYCAFSDGYNCPIPPLENHLNTKIKAGEKKFKKD